MSGTRSLLIDLAAFGINADQWTNAVQGERTWRKDGGTRGEIFQNKMDRCRESQG